MKLSADHRIKDVVEFILSSFGSRFHIGAVGDDILEHFLDNTLRGQIAGLCAGAVLKADGMAFINDHGCDRYFAHNQNLQFYERGHDLAARIDRITLEEE